MNKVSRTPPAQRAWPEIVTAAVSAPENRTRRAAVIQHADPIRKSFDGGSEALIREANSARTSCRSVEAARGEGSTRSVEMPEKLILLVEDEATTRAIL